VRDSLRLLPAPTVCRCAGCEGLAARYGSDPDLLAFYQRQLLLRGWAGSIDDVEAAYMTAHAPWYRAAVERGRRSAARTGWGNRLPRVGEASGPKAEAMPTSRGEAGMIGVAEAERPALETARKPAQLALALG
jgi:hypothetical protein